MIDRLQRAVWRGTSLLEVLASLSILAGVVLSVAALTTFAGRLVGGGLRATHALSTARTAMEEMNGWSFRQIYLRFGCEPTLASCTSIPADPLVATWLDSIRTEVPGVYGEVVIASLDGADLADATALRVTLMLRWREGARRRRVQLVQVRS